MRTTKTSTAALAAAVLAVGTAPALADVTATAATDLNLRSGPGVQSEIIGVIAAEDEVNVTRCIEEANWCEVSYDGSTGWAYGDYLQTTMAEEAEPVAVYPNRTEIEVETVTVEEGGNEITAAGIVGTAGAAAGAIVGGPAAIAAGAVAGAMSGAAATPEERTVTYVRENPVEPVYLQGEAVVGAGVPESVELEPIPESEQFAYVNVNGQPVIVTAEDRKIVEILR
ncbi:DUF1236 domain-containing protein [Tranquillimonas rosea]|uniref:DUF1236 domain-containing protein n=1 Tax=Tranquillimonas rosea TaxID=641238 RepID=UPI003BAA3011